MESKLARTVGNDKERILKYIGRKQCRSHIGLFQNEGGQLTNKEFDKTGICIVFLTSLQHGLRESQCPELNDHGLRMINSQLILKL